jgi:hypothetical protein
LTTTIACKVCRAPNRRRLIEADWADGMSATGISKVMKDAGWPINADTILKHLKEHVEGAAVRLPPKIAPRDASVIIKNAVLDRLEELQKGEGAKLMRQIKGPDGMEWVEVEFDIMDKDLQPALKTALAAETIDVKKADNQAKRKIDLFQLMLGGAGGKHMLAPPELIGDGSIEGEFVEVTEE